MKNCLQVYIPNFEGEAASQPIELLIRDGIDVNIIVELMFQNKVLIVMRNYDFSSWCRLKDFTYWFVIRYDFAFSHEKSRWSFVTNCLFLFACPSTRFGKVNQVNFTTLTLTRVAFTSCG